MGDWITRAIIFGGGLFAVLLGMAALEDKFTSVKENKSFERLKEVLIGAMIICAIVVAVLLFVDSVNQPSAWDACMAPAQNMNDPEAIDWLTEYCNEAGR